jgi:hypothetical protein
MSSSTAAASQAGELEIADGRKRMEQLLNYGCDVLSDAPYNNATHTIAYGTT